MLPNNKRYTKRKTTPKKRGRPLGAKNKTTMLGVKTDKIIEEDVIVRLEEAFKRDCIDTEACAYAGISGDTFYRRKREYPYFAFRIEKAKQYMATACRGIVIEDIVKNKNSDLAFKYLSKRDRRFSDKVENQIIGPTEMGEDEKELFEKVFKENVDITDKK